MCDRYVVVWQLTEVASEHSDLGHRHSDVRVVWSVEKGRGAISPLPRKPAIRCNVVNCNAGLSVMRVV